MEIYVRTKGLICYIIFYSIRPSLHVFVFSLTLLLALFMNEQFDLPMKPIYTSCLAELK